MDLLIHVSDIKTNILDPNIKGLGYVCFSENIFISHFGQYIYLFDKKVLDENFKLFEQFSGSLGFVGNMERYKYRFESVSLEKEYRIYTPINVNKFGIGVITQFNHLKGVFEKQCIETMIEVTKHKFDWSAKV